MRLALAACVAPLLGGPTAASAGKAENAAFQAEICSVLLAPGAPGADESGEAQLKRAAEIQNRFRDRWVGVAMGWRAGPERCKRVKPGVSGLWISPDRQFAVATGGRQDAPLAGSYGECVYERVGGAWALVACEISAVS